MACYKPIALKSRNYQVVPCGRCMGCRLERSRQWALRCVHEASQHEHNQFLTLTYRDEELVLGNYRPTLYPRHLELFWKRLRKEYGNVRYFACGEYGEQFGRPHYHACVFGLDIKDKKLYSIKGGNRIYSSDSIDRIWSHGDCRIGDVTFESAAYVARYICAKQLGESAKFYDEEGIEPEFARMSRRPGIGLPWLERFSADVFNSGFVESRGVKCKPPRYYTDKFKANEPKIMAERLAEQLKSMENSTEFYNMKRLAVKETVKTAQIKSLTRKLT